MDYRNGVAYGEPEQAEQGFVGSDYQLHPLDDALAYFREYARERPEVVALTCFCVGFVLGWKLKPW
jgi:hypothetical protein